MTDVYATSGYWQDIQDAIDLASAEDNVLIPKCEDSFVDVDESWSGSRVVVPDGVNLFGSSTERDANDQVIEYKTILSIPWDMPGGDPLIPYLFRFNGASSRRISDIQFKGYREIDPDSTEMIAAIRLYSGIDFRIDHCSFLSMCGGAIQAFGEAANEYKIRGLIDHCEAINPNGVPAPYASRTVDCGFFPTRTTGNLEWEDNVDKVLGQYTDYTVFIEDCYFEKWRHCVTTNCGSHYVFRHNIIQNDIGYFSLDAHGMDVPNISTRAIEIYENQLLDCIGWSGFFHAITIRGGAAVIFNNTVTDYAHFAYLSRENAVEKYWPHDIWVWNNNLPDGVNPITPYNDEIKGAPVEGEDYFLYEKPDYEPYQYPHPLQGGQPKMEKTTRADFGSQKFYDGMGKEITSRVIDLYTLEKDNAELEDFKRYYNGLGRDISIPVMTQAKKIRKKS